MTSNVFGGTLLNFSCCCCSCCYFVVVVVVDVVVAVLLAAVIRVDLCDVVAAMSNATISCFTSTIINSQNCQVADLFSFSEAPTFPLFFFFV